MSNTSAINFRFAGDSPSGLFWIFGCHRSSTTHADFGDTWRSGAVRGAGFLALLGPASGAVFSVLAGSYFVFDCVCFALHRLACAWPEFDERCCPAALDWV